MTNQTHDLIILGGGCAGLGIGYYFSQLKSNQRIAIIEKRQHYDDDRSWCFWLTNPNFEHKDIVCMNWSKWEVSNQFTCVKHKAPKTPYSFIKSIDYYNKTTKAILNDPRQQLYLDTDIETVKFKNGHYEIKTKSHNYIAPRIIDTRPDFNSILNRSSLFQIFWGFEIQTKGSPFDKSATLLMSNLKSNEEFCQFEYILPINENHAIVEITRFSKTYHSPELLENACTILIDKFTQNYQILRKEAAVLPMGIPKQKQHLSSWYNLSQHYGSLRASSGYGFLRLQSQAQALASQISKNQPLRGAHVDTVIDRWMDQYFCRVLSRNMQCAPDLFVQMAKNLSAGNFALFMNGSINWQLRLQLIKAMPKGLFIRELI